MRDRSGPAGGNGADPERPAAKPAGGRAEPAVAAAAGGSKRGRVEPGAGAAVGGGGVERARVEAGVDVAPDGSTVERGRVEPGADVAAGGSAVERGRRWRLVLGGAADEPEPGSTGSGRRGDADSDPDTDTDESADGPPSASRPDDTGLARLTGRDAAIDRALAAVYDAAPVRPGPRTAGLGASAPSVARWLGDIRAYFPTQVVRVLQRDAVNRLGLRRLLLEPELLEAAEPDVHLVSTLLSLRGALPERTMRTARLVVRKVVDDIERRLEAELHRAVLGALDRAARSQRPRLPDVDWAATIRANLQHYQPELHTIVAERLVGYARRRRVASLKDLILVVDQSGSMAASVVHAGVLAASLASLRAVSTKFVVFDTSVADLSSHLDDPVDLLFATQLGGGTDISQALSYAAALVTRPADTVMVLISDLFEGGDADALIARMGSLVASGVTLIVLLALSDDGTPGYDHDLAAACAGLGAPAFACTPDLFPGLLAAALRRDDLSGWAQRHDIPVAG